MMTMHSARSHQLGAGSVRTSAGRESDTDAGSAKGLNEGLGTDVDARGSAVLTGMVDASDDHAILFDPIDCDKAVATEAKWPFPFFIADGVACGWKFCERPELSSNSLFGGPREFGRQSREPIDLRHQIEIGLPAENDPQPARLARRRSSSALNSSMASSRST